MRLLLVALLWSAAAADESIESAVGGGAIGGEVAHGPFVDLNEYLAQFEKIDPRGLYLFNGTEEGRCGKRIEGVEAVRGVEVRAFVVGGGNGECHLGVRRAGGAWWFLETGGGFSGRSESNVARVSRVERDDGGWRFVLEVEYERWWHEDKGDDITGWYLCN